MANAYMMRQDGRLFPVTVHIYASTEDEDETLAAACWLVDNTAKDNYARDCINYFAAYAKAQDPDLEPDEIADTLEYISSHAPYHIADKGFFDRFMSQFEQLDVKAIPALSQMTKTVIRDLNEEFLRIRIGGAYDTTAGNTDAYFRVSSEYFDWFDLIWQFVYERRSRLSSVTIVKDPESTGVDNQYYNIGGQKAYRMPVDDFINAPSRTVVDAWLTGEPFEKRK